MTKTELLARLHALNKKIDILIITGKPYAKEAKEHTAVRKVLGLIKR